jgi:signal transduction histidine kinase
VNQLGLSLEAGSVDDLLRDAIRRGFASVEVGVNGELSMTRIKQMSWAQQVQTRLGVLCQFLWAVLQPPEVAGEYDKWRRLFLIDRVRLTAILALGIIGALTALNVGVIIPGMNAARAPADWIGPDQVGIYLLQSGIQGIGLLLCLVFTQVPALRQRPSLLFLGCFWSILLLPQLVAIAHGQVEINVDGWMLSFMGHAILVPIQWKLHLIGQLGVISSVLLGAGVWGMRDPFVPIDLTQTTYISAGFYTLIVCFIADLGVYLYERLLRREFDLRQQLRLFLHAVSHDLRNPVLGNTMVLKNFSQTPEPETRIPKPVLQHMIASGDRQLQLINSLIEVHQAETEGIRLQRQPSALAAIVESALADIRPYLEQNQAQLQTSLASDLPWLDIDPAQIQRVYSALLSHVLEHNPPGVEIHLSAQLTSSLYPYQLPKRSGRSLGWIHCSISDNGDRLISDQCSKAFNLYSRGPCARQTLETGLGLYLCQQIIEAHGGAIGVHSLPHQGNRVWFTLPVADR